MTVSACPKKSYLHVQTEACLMLCQQQLKLYVAVYIPLHKAVKTASENGRIVLKTSVQDRCLMGVAAFQSVLTSIIQPGQLQTSESVSV